jgi:hypothetical protein
MTFWRLQLMSRTLARFGAAPAIVVLLVALWALPAFADPRDFTVVNNTSIVLTNVYVSASDTSNWGKDIMGRDVLNPTETVDVNFSDYDGSTCLYDVKVTGQQGQTGLLYKVDLCSTNTVTFSDSN